MRYWLDTEFVDTGHTIDLISIGIVAEDGREYYAQSAEFLKHGKPTLWIEQNVIPHLSNEWTERATIREEIRDFIGDDNDTNPELWGWCAGYDFVALCQLFGTMMDAPYYFPHYIRDIQYILDERGITDEELPEQEEGLHHALEDARHLKRLWGYIVRNDCWQ